MSLVGCQLCLECLPNEGMDFRRERERESTLRHNYFPGLRIKSRSEFESFRFVVLINQPLSSELFLTIAL